MHQYHLIIARKVHMQIISWYNARASIAGVRPWSEHGCCPRLPSHWHKIPGLLAARDRYFSFRYIFLFTSFNMSLWLSDLKTIILAALIFLEKPKKYGPVPFIKFYSHLPIFPLTNWILDTILTLVIFLEKPKKYGPVFSVEKVEGGKEGSGNSGFSSYRSPHCVRELHSYFSEPE